MANVTGKRADKRTEEQRRNDAAQNARPNGTQDMASDRNNNGVDDSQE